MHVSGFLFSTAMFYRCVPVGQHCGAVVSALCGEVSSAGIELFKVFIASCSICNSIVKFNLQKLGVYCS